MEKGTEILYRLVAKESHHFPPEYSRPVNSPYCCLASPPFPLAPLGERNSRYHCRWRSCGASPTATQANKNEEAETPKSPAKDPQASAFNQEGQANAIPGDFPCQGATGVAI